MAPVVARLRHLAVPLRTVQTVRLLQATAPDSVTFTVPFYARPDPGEDDVFRSSVSPSPHGAHDRSSGRHFDGWADRRPASPPDQGAPIVAAHTWLLTTGWRRHGLLLINETPGPEP